MLGERNCSLFLCNNLSLMSQIIGKSPFKATLRCNFPQLIKAVTLKNRNAIRFYPYFIT